MPRKPLPNPSPEKGGALDTVRAKAPPFSGEGFATQSNLNEERSVIPKYTLTKQMNVPYPED